MKTNAIVRTITITGHSDDLIYFEGLDKNIDSGEYFHGEKNKLCSDGEGGFALEYDGSKELFLMRFTEPVTQNSFKIYIQVFYNSKGVWVVAPSSDEEGNFWPGYPIYIKSNGYKMVCEIEVPVNHRVHIKQLI